MGPPVWQQRFRTPVTLFPEWSPRAPDRLVFASNESGTWQLHSLDLADGTRRRVTDHPVGLMDGLPTLDGEGVLWFRDETGAEAGRWVRQPFGEDRSSRSCPTCPSAGRWGSRRRPASSPPR